MRIRKINSPYHTNISKSITSSSVDTLIPLAGKVVLATFKVSIPHFEFVTYTRIQYFFYAPFLAPNPLTMMLPLNSKPLRRVAQLRRQSRHLPTSKTKPAYLTDAVERRKSSHLSLKSTKNLSDAPNHPHPSKISVKNSTMITPLRDVTRKTFLKP